MPSRTIVVLSFLSLFCIICSSYAAKTEVKGPVKTFIIESGSSNTISVKLEGEAISTGCEFKYDTSAGDDKTKKDYTPAPALISQMSKKYGCLSYKHDIFTYEICLEGEIHQRANTDDNSLGKYEKLNEGYTFSQSYVKGTFCEVAHIDRKSVIEFTCADRPNVVSISEPQTCQYKIIIGVPDVCGHPQFQAVSGTKAEAWVLEVSETDEGSIICQVYNNGLDQIDQTTFSSFQLSLTTGDYDLVKHSIRRNRKLVDSTSFTKTTSPAGISIIKPQQIDFAKIVAEI